MNFKSSDYLVNPEDNFKLSERDPSNKDGVPDSKEQRVAYLAALGPTLSELQERLYAEGKRKVLIVLQATDTAGKDGTIKHVFQNTDPLGIRVQAFKAPTERELARDYLWRVHKKVPKDGEMVIFNRSHYEDVLVPKVRGWIDEEEQVRRFGHINDFERLLSDTGTTILKFFLHISKEEQAERLQERLDREDKHWKFNPNDLQDREQWDNFQAEYERVLNATSTDYAPWYVIPANSKSTRNVIIISIILEALEAMQLHYPEVDTSDWPDTVT